eukprot:15209924-Alexandrium_andersonii.AAC.1
MSSHGPSSSRCCRPWRQTGPHASRPLDVRMREPAGTVHGAPGPLHGKLAELQEIVVVRAPRGVALEAARVGGLG